MSLVSFPILAIVFTVGISTLAFAAGGGGAAGGSGAHAQPDGNRPSGEPGPAGATNNMHQASSTPVAAETDKPPVTPQVK
jgi:hypothetical protein